MATPALALTDVVVVGDLPFIATVTPTATDTDDGTISISVDWGDDTASTVPSGVPATHAYQYPGLYTITVTAVTDSDDSSATATASATVYQGSYDAIEETAAGTCEDWFDSDELECGEELDDEELLDMAAVASIRWFFDATCQKYRGRCRKILRPNLNDTRCSPTRHAHGRIDLTRIVAGPIRRIVEVRVDGQVIDPQFYTLVNRRYLAASYGFDATNATSPLIPWPVQYANRQAGAVGTWDVTVEVGATPPPPLVVGAKQFACEIAKQLSPGEHECSIPEGVSSLSRDGVTLNFDRGGNGHTGVKWIDNLLDLYDCKSGRARNRRILDPAAPIGEVIAT